MGVLNMKKSNKVSQKSDWAIVRFRPDENGNYVAILKRSKKTFICVAMNEERLINTEGMYVVRSVVTKCIDSSENIYSAEVKIMGEVFEYDKTMPVEFQYMEQKQVWECTFKSGDLTIIVRPDQSQFGIIDKRLDSDGVEYLHDGHTLPFTVKTVKGQKWNSPDGLTHTFYVSLLGNAPGMKPKKKKVQSKCSNPVQTEVILL